MRIKLNCLSCGHLMVLGEAYESYQGEIRCWGCRATLDVTLVEGRLHSMKLHEERPAVAVPPPALHPEMAELVSAGERKTR